MVHHLQKEGVQMLDLFVLDAVSGVRIPAVVETAFAHSLACGFKSRQTGKTLAIEPKFKAPSFLNEGAL